MEVIADDFLVYGWDETYEAALHDHGEKSKALLQRAREVNLKFNKDKLQLRLRKILYVGHLFTLDGLKPDPCKLLMLAIRKMQSPNDVVISDL